MCSRGNKPFKDDKIANLYKTGDWADCIFFFEDQKIAAHKLILTCSSPVFESMFYGALASAEIHISDIEAEDFQQMLEYIYTNTVTIASVTNAWSLLYISQKYFLKEFKKVCIEYIHFNLTLSTLLLSYEYAKLYNLRQLGDKCWRDILLAAKEVLQVDYHMQASTLCSLLDENEINASEEQLIEAAIKWAEEECTLQNVEVTKENKFKILMKADVFPRLRFARLGKNLYPFLYQLLTSSENVSDYASLMNSSSEQRQRMSFYMNYKFRETYKIEQNISLVEENEFHCVVTPAHKIVAYGIAVTPPHQGGFLPAHSNVVVSVFDKSGNLLGETTDLIKITSDYEHPRLINFSEGVAFEASTPYRISVKYSSVTHNSLKPNELLCFYVSPQIKTHANSTSLYFDDELCGGVVRGISFYVM